MVIGAAGLSLLMLGACERPVEPPSTLCREIVPEVAGAQVGSAAGEGSGRLGMPSTRLIPRLRVDRIMLGSCLAQPLECSPAPPPRLAPGGAR